MDGFWVLNLTSATSGNKGGVGRFFTFGILKGVPGLGSFLGKQDRVRKNAFGEPFLFFQLGFLAHPLVWRDIALWTHLDF